MRNVKRILQLCSIALCFDLPILMMITATMKCRR